MGVEQRPSDPGTTVQVPGWLPRALVTLRPLPALLALGLLVRPQGVPPEASAQRDAGVGTRLALEESGFRLTEGTVHWVDAPRGALPHGHRRALVLAARGEDPADVWLVRVRLSPEGRVLALDDVHNLTETSAAEERGLVVDGRRAAWALDVAGEVGLVGLADLGGDAPPPREWPALSRWQARVTWWQDTGQLAGVGRRHLKLAAPVDEITVRLDPEGLVVQASGVDARVSSAPGGAVTGTGLQEETTEAARPGNLVTWAVDRARALSWFGNDRMQYLKAVAFVALDWLQQARGNVSGDDGSAEVKEQIGDLGPAPPVTYTDPETGWPPPVLEPLLSPVLEGEGQWRLLDQDPFIRTNPGAPAPFAQTFIRVDRKRGWAQTWVVVWDPRQVELHTMSGTHEPKSATGETGPGWVPREPGVMGRLLGAMNGGFQATHGEFGMMAEGVMYLPPKAYAATVAKLADGSTGFGTWPNDETVPANIVGFRQNMTPLVMDGVINPYRRHWWGGVPPGWTEESRTTRSAICLTKEGFVAYLYGTTLDADMMAFAMQRARCVYGIHLDMNAGHTGLEFYRAGPAAEVTPMPRTLEKQWEAEGDVSEMPGWRYRGRRLLKYMGLMNFPRYIQRESRDFMYLTLRHLVPGAAATPAAGASFEGEGLWRTAGLPQHGWPYVLARTQLGVGSAGGGAAGSPGGQPGSRRAEVLLVDPRWLRPAAHDEAAPTVLAFPSPGAPGAGPALWWTPRGAVVASAAPSPEAVLLAVGAAPGSPARAGLGVRSESGMVAYVELPADDARGVAEVLAALGCDQPVLLGGARTLALGGDRDLADRRIAPDQVPLRLVRGQGPGPRRIFEDTPVVKPEEWYPLQQKRVRYFKKPKPAASAAAGGDGSLPAAPE